MVHGQKYPSGFAAGAWGDKALPQLCACKGRASLLCNKAKLQPKGLVCKSEVTHIISPASRKTQKFTEEPFYLEGAPSFIFNNQREVVHGRSDLC